MYTAERMGYREPELSFLVLDFHKEAETHQCLESIKRHTKFEHKVIYLHNGGDVEYPSALLRESLIDQLIQTKQNTGLGIGTRDLFAACFSPYAFYLQNDQYFKNDFTVEDFERIKKIIGGEYLSPHDGLAWKATSVDLAGGFWGWNIYSERAHIIPTEFYKMMERELDLGYYGAGPWHDGPWREGKIQQYFKENRFINYTYDRIVVADNGHRAVRQNADGSIWEQQRDTLKLRLVQGPVKEKAVYPPLTDSEWEEVFETQSWPEWKVPEKQVGQKTPRDWQ